MFSKIKAVGRRAATVAAGTVLVLSQCLGSFGAAFAPSTAYADTSTKTATVTLADTENGSLSFVGRDDDTKTITVNVGETVAINPGTTRCRSAFFYTIGGNRPLFPKSLLWPLQQIDENRKVKKKIWYVLQLRNMRQKAP